jgi:hypothetical protein
MKKVVLVLLSFVLSLSLIACNQISQASEVTSESATEPAPNYVKPVKTAVTAEEQELLDKYYEELLQAHPSFADIPREMLNERIYIDEERISVYFEFYLGGIRTDCRAYLITRLDQDKHKWTVKEDEFKKFYKSGLTEEQMNEIKSALASQIQSSIDAYKLQQSNNLKDTLNIYWEVENGKFYAMAECIVNVTDETTKTFGCGSHAHLFAKFELE